MAEPVAKDSAAYETNASRSPDETDPHGAALVDHFAEQCEQDLRRTAAGKKSVIHTLPDGHIPDGLKIDAAGDLWIATVASGGVDHIRKDGTPFGRMSSSTRSATRKTS